MAGEEWKPLEGRIEREKTGTEGTAETNPKGGSAKTGSRATG